MGFENLPKTTADLAQEQMAKLRALFPECVTEGPAGLSVDFDLLRQSLSSEAVVEGPNERYRLEWPGKRAARYAANAPTASTLRPVRERSKDFDATRNLYVEGDNLEALKLLRTAYSGKVKLIYIDPPYNTGHDFIYHDKYVRTVREEMVKAGLLDDEGRQTEDKDPFQKNDETNGRYHSDWLTMMYPRLLLARDLLADDGVIFISIDDNEQANLKRLCDEVFGAGNFVAQLVWQRAFAPKNDARFVSNSHDYVLMFARDINSFKIGRLPRTEEANARYANPDNDPRGVWMSSDMSVKTYSAANDYPIVTPAGVTIEPPAGRCWSLAKNEFLARLQDNRIWFGPDGKGVPRIKRFLSELKFDGMAPTSILFYKEVGHSQEGTQEVVKLLEAGVFDGPKPVRLLRRLMTLANLGEESIVMDFFSGSGSTAHAVMAENAEKGKRCPFILVQLPAETSEKEKKAGFADICVIGEERIRRAGEAILGERPELRGKLDVGFRVLRLDEKNEVQAAQTPDDALTNWDVALQEETIKAGRTEEDLLFQALLRVTEPLLVERIEREVMAGLTVWSVADGFVVACLVGEGQLTAAKAEAVTRWIVGQAVSPSYVAFREAGFADDSVKLNVEAGLRQAGCRATLWVL